MPRTRAIIIGGLATVWTVMFWGLLFEVGLVIGILTMILVDVPFNSGERKRLGKMCDDQQMRLAYSEQRIVAMDQQNRQMQEMLSDREGRLQNMIVELERRDSVGAPEARKLIEDQKEALTAQRQAMEEARELIESQQKVLAKLEAQAANGHGRWEETLATLERMLANQASVSTDAQQQMLEEISNGNRELQRALTDLLRKLATQPRNSSVSVRDSVVLDSNIADNRKRPSRRSGDRIPKLNAIPIGKPQRIDEEVWLKSLPEELV